MIYRTTHPIADFTLSVPQGCSELHLLATASLALIGGPARVEILTLAGEEETRRIGDLRIEWEDWAVHAIPVSLSPSASVTFRLRTLTTAIPDRVLHNGDHRELGIHVAAAILI
jgi:hypothetical protein